MSSNRPTLSKRQVQPNHSGQLEKTRLVQYVGFFAIGYVLSSAVFMMIQSKVTISSQLVTVLSVLIGAYIAVNKFIKHHQRALTTSEINRLTVGSIGAVWLATIIYFFSLWLLLFDAIDREVLIEMTAQQPLPLLSALVMILLLTLVSARIGVWVFNRLLAPK
ncbi:hypothetical protein RCH20_002372 [Psychrobacter sp. PL15]|uniref:ABZJ_00895 family protein n=1 Tax=Psychrobacter sp. PL15 TaxID=3071719 RepID=UPI002E0C1459|nr:hypothetical protein [Psychrobacter sp. PL15]